MCLDINLKTFPQLSGFCALASVSLADKPLGQYASGGAGGFGGGGFGGSAFGGAGGGFGDDSQYAGGAGGAGGGDNLEEVIPGIPGDDYPIFAEVPDTSFFCDGQTDGGYYSDPEAECQAFHICAGDGTGGLTKYSFLCPNGTLFNQQYFVCDWWFNVDCSLAESLYALNDEIAAEREANSPAGGQGQYGGGQGQGGAGGRSGGNKGQSQYGNSGGAGGRSASRGGSKGSRASASSSRNSYSAPSDSYSSSGSSASPTYSFPEEFGGNGFGPADSGYGAPSNSAGAGYGAPSSASLDTGYGAPGGAADGYGAPSYSGRTGRRRNTRQLVAEPELE